MTIYPAPHRTAPREAPAPATGESRTAPCSRRHDRVGPAGRGAARDIALRAPPSPGFGSCLSLCPLPGSGKFCARACASARPSRVTMRCCSAGRDHETRRTSRAGVSGCLSLRACHLTTLAPVAIPCCARIRTVYSVAPRPWSFYPTLAHTCPIEHPRRASLTDRAPSSLAART